MAKTPSESSQPAKPHPENETFMVRESFDPEAPLQPASRERLKKLAELPDQSIRTDLIPELPREAWKTARRNPYLKLMREQAQRKAS